MEENTIFVITIRAHIKWDWEHTQLTDALSMLVRYDIQALYSLKLVASRPNPFTVIMVGTFKQMGLQF
jgi:hypothetical protein